MELEHDDDEEYGELFLDDDNDYSDFDYDADDNYENILQEDNYPYFYHEERRSNYCPENYSPLVNAIYNGDLDQIYSLLNTDSIEEKFNGTSLVHLAAARGHDKIVDLLCQRNFPVNEKDSMQNTPLHLSIKENHYKVFNILLNKTDVNAKNECGETPLHVAAANNRIPFAERLLDNGAIINAQDFYGKTPLHLALQKRFVHLAEFLIEHNADIHAEDTGKQTPLHLATKITDVHLVELLLEKGAKVNVQDKGNKTPLLIAAEGNCFQLVELFLKIISKIDEPQKTEMLQVMTPLHYAARNGNLEMVKLLFMNGYNTSAIQGKQKETPLELAVNRGSFEVVKYLIDDSLIMPKNDRLIDPPSDNPVDPVDDSQYPCIVTKNLLHISLCKSYLDIWKYLLKHSSRIDTRRCSDLHLAVRDGQVETVQKILDETNENDPYSLDNRLAVYIAVESGNATILNILLKSGYSIETCFNDRTLVHLAATFEDTKLMEILLQAGADINLKTINGYTPLVFAAAAGHSDMVKFLLKSGANPTMPFNQISPLMFTLKRGKSISDIWTVTPFLFENLVKITEMLLIAADCKSNYSSSLCQQLIGYSIGICVSFEKNSNELNLSESKLKESKRSDTNKLYENCEFRPEIVKCILNYVKDGVIQTFLLSSLFLRNAVDFLKNPHLLDIALEYNDYQLNDFQMSVLNRDYKCNLLLISHVKDVDVLTNVKVNYLLMKSASRDKVYMEVFKMIVARLLLLSNVDEVERKKLEFCEKFHLVDFLKECENQVTKMKEIEISVEFNVTVYDILTQPVNRIASYVKSENLLQNLESMYNKFPAYTDFLKLSVEKGKRRRKLIETCENSMFNLVERNFEIQIPNICIDKILHYLSVLDLLRLSAVYL